MNPNNYILSIESSSDLCGIALSLDNEIIAEHYLISRNLHDKLLAEIVRKLLLDLELQITDLNAIAISSGPGSFTGLRIGAALAKGICFGNEPKLIAVPTLEALAYGIRKENEKLTEEIISVIIPSHKNQSYFQQFDSKSNDIAPIVLIENEAISQNVNESLIVLTDRKLILDLPSNRVISTPIYPRYILELGNKYYSENKFIASEEFTPNYAQEFEVKVSQKQ